MQVPARFEYEVAGSVEEAIELLQRHGPEAYLMAGGHSLLPMMKLRLASPEVVIAIHKLDGELRYVRDDGGVLRIGALARHRDVGESALIRDRYTLLADAEKFIADGDNTYGGRVVTNPSGGLLSKGHPLGATGLAQCAELVWQLRGQAGARQVPDPKIALQHNIGLGGAAVVTLYERTD